MNYYRRYPGDYARDTRHLTLTEHGAYTLLLDYLYGTQRVLPGLPLGLYRICGAHSEEEKKAVDNVVDQFFIKGPDGYTHPRVDDEIKQLESRVKAAVENGKKGGRPAKAETQQKPSGLANEKLNHNRQKSSPSSNHQPEEEEKSMSADADAITPARLVEIFQQEQGALPGVRELNAQRLSKCRQRLLSHKAQQEKFLADFREAVRIAGQKQWPSWRPSFDWFIENDKNYLKVLEGNYDNWVAGGVNGTTQQPKSFDAIRREEGDAATRSLLNRYLGGADEAGEAHRLLHRRVGKANLP